MKLAARFKDENLEAALNRDGFIHVPGFLTPEEVKEMYALYRSLHTDKTYPKPMWNSLYDLPEGRGSKISEKLRSLLLGKFSAWLQEFKMPVATFMVKNPTADSNCDLHRDYSAFDETRFEYRNGWIPLVDINEKNGALYVVPKSNHVFDYCLPMMAEWPYRDLIPELMKHIKVVYARAGDLVVYKDLMLHGSYQNHTAEPRPVLHFGMLHPEARTSFYRRDAAGGRVDVFSVPPEFFFEKDFDAALAGKTPERSFTYAPPALNIKEVIEKINS